MRLAKILSDKDDTVVESLFDTIDVRKRVRDGDHIWSSHFKMKGYYVSPTHHLGPPGSSMNLFLRHIKATSQSSSGLTLQHI